MAHYEDIFSMIMPEVPGCPAPLAIQNLRQAAREFCQQTWIWQDTVPFEIEADYREAYVSVPRDGRLVAVRYLLEDGQELDVPDKLMIKTKRDPVEFEHEPEKSKNLQARVVLQPREDSKECPDWLVADHAEAIASGAKRRLMLMPGKDWSNPDLAKVHYQEFRREVARARVAISKGYSEKSLRVQPRSFR
ncbi:MAG: hypothetical protein ACOC43_03205 [Desulfohalobiaceae bacterium]